MTNLNQGRLRGPLTAGEAALEVLARADEPLSAKELSERAGRNYSTIRGALRVLFRKGQVVALNDETYCLPDQFPEAIRKMGVQPLPEPLPEEEESAEREPDPAGRPAIIIRHPDGRVWARLRMRFDVEIAEPLDYTIPAGGLQLDMEADFKRRED
jgi:hypothetical protein